MNKYINAAEPFITSLFPLVITSIIFVEYDTSSYKMYLDLTIFALFFYLPIVAMILCTGWNSGTMATSSCRFQNKLIKSLADSSYNFLFFSAFTLLIPIAIYYALVIGLSSSLTLSIDYLIQHF